jgi:hypothetical protein
MRWLRTCERVWQDFCRRQRIARSGYFYPDPFVLICTPPEVFFADKIALGALGKLILAAGKAGALSKGGRPRKTGSKSNPVKSLGSAGVDKNLVAVAPH